MAAMHARSILLMALSLTALPLCAVQPRAAQAGELTVDEHTLALWHLDEAEWTGAPDEVRDASGNRHHATARGGAIPAAQGRFGRGARFQAGGQYLSIPDAEGRLALFDRSYSFEAWFRTDDRSRKWQTIYSSGVGSHSGFHCYFHGGGIYFFTYINGDDRALKALSCPWLEEAKWHYIAITREAETGVTILYVNGERRASFTGAGTSGSRDAGGHRIGDGKATFDGCIDEVRISSVARTAREIRAHYGSAPAAPAVRRPAVRRRWVRPRRPGGPALLGFGPVRETDGILRTLYVSPRGNDANDGVSPDRPVRTLTRAARLVKPGDLVLVAGGTYQGWVKLRTAGTAEHPIVWRARQGETALLTYRNRPTGWQKVKGTRFTWATQYEGHASTVWEDRTVTRYAGVDDLATLDELPGSFHYDEANQLLSVHCLRGSPPDEALPVVNDHIVDMRPTASRTFPRLYPHVKGFFVVAPYNRVEGFMVAYVPYGIQIRSHHCEIRNNTVYGCWNGIGIRYSGAGNVLEGNECFLNDWSGVYVSRCTEVTVRDNLCWHNGPRGPFREAEGARPHNLSLYGTVSNVTVIGNTAIWGGHGGLWRHKGPREGIITKNNVLIGGSGYVTCNETSVCANNTVVGGHLTQYARSEVDGKRHPLTPEGAKKWYGGTAQDNLYVEHRRELPGVCVADADRHDYRLRKDSPYLGQGAFPDPAPVRYVSPGGDDAGDGETPASAWRTLGRAASAAQPGDTVYVMPGTYAESVTISLRAPLERPICFRSYGGGQVVLDGGGQRPCGITLAGASGVLLEGFIIRGFGKACVKIEDGGSIRLIENIADGAKTGIVVKGTQNLAVQNNTFTRCRKGVEADGVQGQLILRNNIFCEIGGTPLDWEPGAGARLVSERNGFSGTKAEAQLATWRERFHEPHPSLLGQVTLCEDYGLPTGHRFGFAGIGHRPIGARGALPWTATVEIEDFRAAAVFPTYAVISWKTPRDFADAVLRLKLPNGDERTVAVQQGGAALRSVLTKRLADLRPGTRYTLKLRLRTASGRRGRGETSFETPATVRDATTLYVATSGDDRNDGRSPARAFRTLRAAAYAACPGDTVLVGPGRYPESLELWCGGVSGRKPLTFRSAEPGEAVLAPSKLTPVAITIRDLKHIVIDGFEMRSPSVGNPVLCLRTAQDIIFRNNICRHGGVDAYDSRGVIIQNNVFLRPWHAVMAYRCEDVTVDHNTCHRGLISGVYLRGPFDARWRITNNIFADVIDPDKKNAVINIGSPSKNLVCDYNLYWRDQCPKMGLFGFRSTRDGKPIGWSRQDAQTIDDLHRMFGIGAHSRFGDPLFMGTTSGDYRLKPGSPAIGMAVDGGNVGMRNPPRRLER